MNNYIPKHEIDVISEGMIKLYFEKVRKKVEHRVDIEDFITSFLGLKIEYVSFAEVDEGKVGFLSDGSSPLLICRSGEIIPFVFPEKTVVVEQSLLKESETGRRRFTLAHEAAHNILDRMNMADNKSEFYSKEDKEREYTLDEYKKMQSNVEYMADRMAASLLMPAALVDNALKKVLNVDKIKIYDEFIKESDKLAIKKVARYLGVSYSALRIRLLDLNKLEMHPVTEYISKELLLGGICG